MSTIQDEAFTGKLTEARVKSLITGNPAVIDSVGGANNVTALAAACWGGHLDTVKLLLRNDANPDALSPRSRTPFFFVTTRSPPRDRGAIAQALLDAHASIDLATDEEGNTPLMNAIVQCRDTDVIHLLVDSKASQTKANKRQPPETAAMLAQRYGLSRHLKDKDERSSSRGKIVDIVVSIVLLVVHYANVLTGGVLEKLFNWRGDKAPAIQNDPNIDKEVPVPRTAAEFEKNLNKYIEDKTFKKFFARGDDFLQKLARNASRLTQDDSGGLGNPDNINRLTRLSLYQPILYCDDSGSMKWSSGTTTRMAILKELVIRIASVATRIVPDDAAGVELHFINQDSPSPSLLTLDQIKTEMQHRDAQNMPTNIGTNLKAKILDPLVYNVISQASKSVPIPLKRPILVCIITDGCPNPEREDTLMEAMLECKQELVRAGYEPTAVMFLISQIGSDEAAESFLKKLRENVRLKQVLHCTTDRLDEKFHELNQNEKSLEQWLLHLLTTPLMPSN
ncbi:hypothetical protein FISHEDRAFT_75620 [Fistulina hepatica ATCC 64428]|uniref:Uncharacterized protein n=1 Tax=Fistulina hepatica ATCC 64428 TaxID=1128425 RepID=A0A0D7A6N1_9AGAR|nr:hypothetical protein FISHEDRAFT_75620 [Fistulina hepatica ATCC 64428]